MMYDVGYLQQVEKGKKAVHTVKCRYIRDVWNRWLEWFYKEISTSYDDKLNTYLCTGCLILHIHHASIRLTDERKALQQKYVLYW
jgi:hypothetical protein